MAEHMRDLWDFQNGTASEKRFDEYLKSLNQNDFEERTLVQTQIARAQGLQRRFDEARETVRDAHATCPDGFLKGEGWCEIEAGRIENSSGNVAAARVRFLKALQIAEEADLEFLAIDALHMLGVIDKGQASLDWNEKAIQMAENAKGATSRNWLGSLLNNSGWTYYDLGDYAKAIAHFEKAVDFRKESGKEPYVRIARYCVAKCHRAMGHLETALQQQLELEEEGLAAGDEPGFTFEEIGECFLAIGQEEEARLYFAKAYEALSKDEWLMAEEPERVERLGRLAGTPKGS